MGQSDYYEHGTWNAICDRCGFKFKANRLRLEWDGLMVCSQCWEPRHPQDFVRAVRDVQAPPWTRPDTQVFGAQCTPDGLSCVVGKAVVGCSIVDKPVFP